MDFDYHCTMLPLREFASPGCSTRIFMPTFCALRGSAQASARLWIFFVLFDSLVRNATFSRKRRAQVQRELMILGLISFVLFLMETSGGAVQLGESWLVPFEFAHFLIFFVAIVYTFQAFWLAVMVSSSAI